MTAFDVTPAFRFLEYNKITGEFYAVRTSAFGDTLMSLQIGSNTITGAKDIAYLPAKTTSTTMDNKTGKLYILSGENNIRLHAYQNGTVSNIPLFNMPDRVKGLRYSEKYGRLYANGPGTIYAVNPATGNVSAVATYPFDIEVDIHSAVIDQCNNQYIISGLDLKTVGTGQKGGFVVYDIVTGDTWADTMSNPVIYQGLAVY